MDPRHRHRGAQMDAAIALLGHADDSPESPARRGRDALGLAPGGGDGRRARREGVPAEPEFGHPARAEADHVAEEAERALSVLSERLSTIDRSD